MIDLEETLRAVVERVSTVIHGVTALLTQLAGQADDPAGLESLVRAAIEDPDSVVLGAGVVTASRPQAVLAWWWRREGSLSQLMVQLDPHSIVFYDVESQPWFVEPLRTGTLAVVGPYFDRSGTDATVVTLTVPLSSAPPAVAGADLDLDALFRLLVRDRRAVETKAILENLEGRVIASADPDVLAGELDQGPWLLSLPCPMLPWRVVVRRSGARH